LIYENDVCVPGIVLGWEIGVKARELSDERG